jgi:hypothetical protein
MTSVINGIFLLVLTIASNFTEQTLGCRTQKYLTDNVYAKHILNLVFIFFCLNLTNRKVEHPTNVMKKSIIVWIGYMLFVRMNGYYTILTSMALLVIYSLGLYIDYYKSITPKTDDINKKIKEYENIKTKLMYAIPAIIICGFAVYGKEKYAEHGDKFSLVKLIAGAPSCFD